MSKRESKKRIRRRSKAYRKRVILYNIIFFAIIIISTITCCINIFTDKKKLREEGLSLYEQKDYVAAIVKFDKALNTNQWFDDKMDLDILLYKAQSYIAINDYISAGRVYQETLNRYKNEDYIEDYISVDELEFLFKLCEAMNNYNNNDFVSPVAKLTEACERGYTELALYTANCYENQKQYDEMIKYLDIYSASYGYDAFIYYKYSSAYIFKGDYQNALINIKKGIEYNDAEYTQKLKYLQIMCFEKLGDYTNAFNLAKDYISEYPNDKDGKNVYDYLYTRVNIDTEVVNDIYEVNTTDNSAEEGNDNTDNSTEE